LSPGSSAPDREPRSCESWSRTWEFRALEEKKDQSKIEEIEKALEHEQEQDDDYWQLRADDERALVRKLDKRILPIACILYLFAYLDRTNLGNAKLQGIEEDALGGDPTGQLFDWVNSAFFFSYILFQVPATVYARYFPPRLWLGTVAIGWGICSTLMSTGFNFPGLIVARVGLGVFEAGFGPGIPVYMALFYSKNEMGLRMAYWFGFAAIAGAFGGIVAFGVQHIHAAVHDWRLLFIIEGIPTVILGIFAMFYLPDRPENPRSANFFTEEERGLQIARMNRYSSRSTPGTVNKKHVMEALTDWRVYLGGVMYFGFNCALASTSAFLPTILKTLGFSNANAQLLTVPPVCPLTAWVFFLPAQA